MPVRAVLGLVMSVGLSCAQPASDSAESRDPDPQVPGPPSCRAPRTTDALALFDGGPCGWELVDDNGALSLSSLAAEAAPPAKGTPPEICNTSTCIYEGHVTAVGPVIVVHVPSAASEMPAGVWLGWTSGSMLGFVDLWEDAGPEVIGDDTPLGPSHALVPYRCGDGVALLTGPRTNAGTQIDPAPSLRARQGRYELSASGATRVADAPADCTPLGIPLP